MHQLEGNLKSIMLSKRLTQKSTNCVIPFVWSSETGKTKPGGRNEHSDGLWIRRDKDWWEHKSEGTFLGERDVPYLFFFF